MSGLKRVNKASQKRLEKVMRQVSIEMFVDLLINLEGHTLKIVRQCDQVEITLLLDCEGVTRGMISEIQFNDVNQRSYHLI